jgi:uncharacterized protein (DUF983 family)
MVVQLCTPRVMPGVRRLAQAIYELLLTGFRILQRGVLMFCPKCGQEQASESVRFCSRCGFNLNTVDEALANRVIKMAMYLVLTMCAIIGWGSITAGPAYMQVRVIITLFAAMTFYLLFSRDLKHVFNKLSSQNIEQIKQATPASQESALPPAQSIPVQTLGSHRVSTAEIVQPTSVTEQTTILLDKNKR